MNFPKITKLIIELKDADLKFREKLIKEKKLSEGYNNKMETLHIKNAKKLNEIIDEIRFSNH
jgi:hypothetical protein